MIKKDMDKSMIMDERRIQKWKFFTLLFKSNMRYCITPLSTKHDFPPRARTFLLNTNFAEHILSSFIL